MSNTTDPTQTEHFRIVAAAGGTGGHIYPAVAVIEALERITHHRTDTEFLGSEDRMETSIIPELGYPLTRMPIRGFRGVFSLSNIQLAWRIIRSIQIARNAIQRFRPHVVLCTGAYISYPAGVAASRERIPLVLMESNLNLGKSNARLLNKADRIVLAFEESRKYLPHRLQERAVVLGNPVRTSITGSTNQAVARIALGLQPDVPTLLIFGGSLGARTINNAVQRIVNLMTEYNAHLDIQLLWQTGKGFDPSIPKSVAPRVKHAPYISDMELAFSAADVVLSRSGATTIAELGIVGKPAVLVPLPSAATNEQRHNAYVVQQAGGGLVVDDDKIDHQLQDVLSTFFNTAHTRIEMGAAMKKLGKPRAAVDVARMLLEIGHHKHLEKME